MKEGFVREDGMVFWKNSKEKGEIWLRPEQYSKWCETRKKYRERCAREYYKRREKLNEMDRPYFGKYDFSRNLYYIGVSSAGKEVWINKQRYENLLERRKKYRSNYVKKLQQEPKTNLRFGDPHPDDPNLFVILMIGNKPFFGPKERLDKRRECLRRTGVKRDIKDKHKRKQILEQLGENRIPRGAYDLETGLVFWEYSQNGKERWMPVEEFHRLRTKGCEKRKSNRMRKKLLSIDQKMA